MNKEKEIDYLVSDDILGTFIAPSVTADFSIVVYRLLELFNQQSGEHVLISMQMKKCSIKNSKIKLSAYVDYQYLDKILELIKAQTENNVISATKLFADSMYSNATEYITFGDNANVTLSGVEYCVKSKMIKLKLLFKIN
jgi:hypothetical protein